MPLEQIIKRIEENAIEEKKKIEDEAAAKSEKLLAGARGKLEKLKAEKKAETEAEIENERKRRLALKRLDLRNAVLRLKRDIINEVFEEAFEEVRGLPDADYLKLMEKLFLNFAEPGKGAVYIAERDSSRLTPEFIEQASGKLGNSGKDYDYRLSDDFADIGGGFVLETESTKIDCSLEALFAEIRDELERQTGELLFKNG